MIQETEQRLSRKILRLGDLARDSLTVAQECVLTAFSIHPTRECLDRIKEMAIICGKTSPEVESGKRNNFRVEVIEPEVKVIF